LNLDIDPLIDALPAQVWIALPDGRIEFMNRRLYAYTGIGPDQATDQGWRVAIHPADLERAAEFWSSLLKGERPRDLEARLRRHDGEYRRFSFSATQFSDKSGPPLKWCGINIDVEERRQAEEKLQVREAELSRTQYHLTEGQRLSGTASFSTDPAIDEHTWSDEFYRICGFELGSRPTIQKFRNIVHPEDRKSFDAVVEAGLAGQDFDFTFRIVTPAGVPKQLRGVGRLVDWISGRPIFVGAIQDMTAAKLAEAALLATERDLRAIVDAIPAGVALLSTAGAIEVANQPLLDYVGKTREELIRSGITDAVHVEDLTPSTAALKISLATGTPYDVEQRLLRFDGTYRWFHVRGHPIVDADGSVARWYILYTDIDERKRAEEAVRENEHYISQILNSIPVLVAVFTADGQVEFVNRRTTDYFGSTTEDLKRWQEGDVVHPDDHARVMSLFGRAIAAGEPFEWESRARRHDGVYHWLQSRGSPLKDKNGKIVRWYNVLIDVDERKRAEEALRVSEERYAIAVAGSNEGIFDWDLATDRVYLTRHTQELIGLEPGEPWRAREEWKQLVTFHPDDASRVRAGIKSHLTGRSAGYDVDFRLVLPGGPHWFNQRGVALRNASGVPYRMAGSIGDIDERVRAQEEMQRLEARLRQAQRFEAMGALAGGIAHDFNNILGAILGYGERALRGLDRSSRARRDLDQVVTASNRGRALVDTILAFSRGSSSERVAVDVERVVSEAVDLLKTRLALGTALHTRLFAGRAAIVGDPTQVHQVVMNLGTNAIQAMPSGGTLSISLETAHIEAPRSANIGILRTAEYVVLGVADTGTGIPPEILERVFDPFFTTKEPGTGSGLGLSLVLRIVTEAGGAIDVSSAPGRGSVFTVYLPRAGDAPPDEADAEPALPRGRGQRVLVVDDEKALLTLVTESLDELGYATVGFTSSTAALEAFRAEPARFDALIADGRMPGLSGADLIREVRSIRRTIPLLLISGDLSAMAAPPGDRGGPDAVLRKPVSMVELATCLARMVSL